MSGFSVIIPSKNEANLRACVSAIRAAGETCRIIVVWDGGDWACPDGIDATIGVKPFIFSRNVNIGIRAAGEDDVILLNDDALLETPMGFTRMHQESRRNIRYGVISSACNAAGNPEQRQSPGGRLRRCFTPTPGNSVAVVAFVCVLIPRPVMHQVGFLDERFGGETSEGRPIYGYEDNDYCRRVQKAGLQIGIFDGCYTSHTKLPSTFRSQPYDMAAGQRIYLAKWGTM